MSSVCRPEDAARSKYALTHTVRTHLACDDDAYLCEGYGEDKEGFRGGFMRKNVIEVAQRAVELNVAALAKALTPLPVKVGSLLAQISCCPGCETPLNLHADSMRKSS